MASSSVQWLVRCWVRWHWVYNHPMTSLYLGWIGSVVMETTGIHSWLDICMGCPSNLYLTWFVYINLNWCVFWTIQSEVTYLNLHCLILPIKIYGWEVLCFAFKWHCFSFLISEYPLLLLLIPMYSDEWLPIDHVKLAPNILPALYSNWRKLLLIVDHITIALNIFGFLSQLPQAKLLALMWWISTPRSGHCSSVWGIIGLSQGPRSKLSYERLRQVPERIKFLLANWKLELLMFSSSSVQLPCLQQHPRHSPGPLDWEH